VEESDSSSDSCSSVSYVEVQSLGLEKQETNEAKNEKREKERHSDFDEPLNKKLKSSCVPKKKQEEVHV